MGSNPLLIRPEVRTTLHQFSCWCYEAAAVWDGIAQGRKVNKQRGAWRRPQLAKAVSDLNKVLLTEYDLTEHAIALLLAGEEPPAVQADPASDMAAALAHHGLAPEDVDRAVDPRVLAVILLVLARFREKQLGLAGAAIETVYQASRKALLKRLGYPSAPELPETSALTAQVTQLYQSDAQRFYGDLLDGTSRSTGVRAIVEGTRSLGPAVVAIRALFDAEQFRLTLFSEHLVWSAWMAGVRAAAVEGTSAAREVGVTPPSFQWTGPADAKTCAPCLAMFRGPVVARSLVELPDPSTICSGGRNCRHWWAVS